MGRCTHLNSILMNLIQVPILSTSHSHLKRHVKEKQIDQFLLMVGEGRGGGLRISSNTIHIISGTYFTVENCLISFLRYICVHINQSKIYNFFSFCLFFFSFRFLCFYIVFITQRVRGGGREVASAPLQRLLWIRQ